MSFGILIEHQPLPDGIVVHPAMTGYIATLHDEEYQQTVHVGMLAPQDLLDGSPGDFPTATGLFAWIARGLSIHDIQAGVDTIGWLSRALERPHGLRPVVLIPGQPDAEPIAWTIHTSLEDLRSMAEADLDVMDFQMRVACAQDDTQEALSRL